MLPRVVLSLEEKSPFDGGDELLGSTAIVGIIRFSAAAESDSCTVVEVIVPERIDAVSTGLGRPHELGDLRFVFRNQHDRSPASRSSGLLGNHAKNMFRRVVEDLLSRIEAQAIEVKLFNPVAGIRHEKFAHGPAVVAFEVDRLAPFVLVAVCEVRGGELLKIIPIGPEMVVDDVEKNSQAQMMRAINKGSEVIRRAVQMRWSKQIDSIVSPPKATCEFCDGHDFQQGDSDVGQLGKKLSRGVPRSL